MIAILLKTFSDYKINQIDLKIYKNKTKSEIKLIYNHDKNYEFKYSMTLSKLNSFLKELDSLMINKYYYKGDQKKEVISDFGYNFPRYGILLISSELEKYKITIKYNKDKRIFNLYKE